jgi:hypothetical protein
MRTRRTCIALLCLTAACDRSPKLENGFDLIDGGGSKTSLAKDGKILINYTVTGVGQFRGKTVIENKPYGSNHCDYFLVGAGTVSYTELSRVSGPATAYNVVAINGRSCAASN